MAKKQATKIPCPVVGIPDLSNMDLTSLKSLADHVNECIDNFQDHDIQNKVSNFKESDFYKKFLEATKSLNAKLKAIRSQKKFVNSITFTFSANPNSSEINSVEDIFSGNFNSYEIHEDMNLTCEKVEGKSLSRVGASLLKKEATESISDMCADGLRAIFPQMAELFALEKKINSLECELYDNLSKHGIQYEDVFEE
jgi:hypothetical protein